MGGSGAGPPQLVTFGDIYGGVPRDGTCPRRYSWTRDTSSTVTVRVPVVWIWMRTV